MRLHHLIALDIPDPPRAVHEMIAAADRAWELLQARGLRVCCRRGEPGGELIIELVEEPGVVRRRLSAAQALALIEWPESPDALGDSPRERRR